MEKLLRILFIEDSEDDVFLISSHIQSSGYTVSATRVDTEQDFMKALQQVDYWDVILSDYSLPGFSGRKALDCYRKSGQTLPFILVTGSLGEDIAVQMLKSGASDFILKQNLERLVPAIELGMAEYKQRRELQASEKTKIVSEDSPIQTTIMDKQAQSLDLYKTLFQDNIAMILVIDPDTSDIVYANHAACKFYGFTFEQLLAKRVLDLSVLNKAELFAEFARVPVTSNYQSYDKHKLADGQIKTLEIQSGLINWNGKSYIQAVLSDIAGKFSQEKIFANIEVYQDLLEILPACMLIEDMDNTILFANSEFVKLLGYSSAGELVKRKSTDLLSSKYYQGFVEQHIMDSIIRNGQLQGIKIEFIKKNGTPVYCSVDCRLIKDPQGKPSKIVSIFSDTSKQHRAYQELERSELRYRSNFENAPIGIAMVTMDNSFIQVNRAFIKMLHWESCDYSQYIMPDLFPPEEAEIFIMHMHQLLDKSEASIEWESRIKPDIVQTVQVQISANLISYESVPQYYLIRMEDITTKKQAVQDILEAKHKVEESDRIKSAILTNMSHEFRTPMNGILGFADILHTFNVSEQINGIADMIKTSGQRLMQTLESLLILSQLESAGGSIKTNLQYLSISDEIASVIRRFSEIAASKGLALRTDIADKIYTMFDKKLLSIAITNLIDNAIKFSPQGSIYISLSPIDVNSIQHISIVVKDEGIGIPQKYMKQMFDDFSQQSQGFSRSYEGSGIGLAIAQKIVRLFKGQISVKSEEGIGTEVTVLIPYDRPEDASVKPEAVLSPASIIKAPRVLIVEDNIVNTKLLVHFLQDYAQMIDCVETGEFAVEMSQTHIYDTIFMDINFGSGIDGIEATRQIRRIAGYETTPIVAVTGYTMIGDRERLLASGLSHYIGKPYNQKEIRDMFVKLQT